MMNFKREQTVLSDCINCSKNISVDSCNISFIKTNLIKNVIPYLSLFR